MFKAVPLTWEGRFFLFHALCLPRAAPVPPCAETDPHLHQPLFLVELEDLVLGRVTRFPHDLHGSSLQSAVGGSFDFE